MNRPPFKHLLCAGALAAAAFVGAPAHAGPFGNLVVFGDSLSDSGNNFLAGLYDPAQVVTGNTYVPSSTYASSAPFGTYSDGPVWASYFATSLGLTLTPSLAGGGNFAFGGATTGTPGPGPGGFPFSLRTQATQFLGATGGVASPDALYVIAGGGNNARAALDAIGGGANVVTTATATAAAFANDVGTIVDQLQAAGAQHIVVWNAPNLGLAPAVVAAGAGAVGAGTFVANAMNASLAARLASEAGVATFDLYGFGAAVAANPAAFGFTNTADACGAVAGANCSQYAYYDGIHPTTAAHRVIAGSMLATAAMVPEPETYALFAVGLGALAVCVRRRKARAEATAA